MLWNAQSQREDSFSPAGNQVRGLDEEEAKFLDFVSDQQEKIEKKRETEEAEAINEYRVSLATTCLQCPTERL